MGHTINVHMDIGEGDEDYIKAFKEILKPSALQYRPDFVLVSAGFDAHSNDPLSGTCLSEKGFEAITRIVREIADECCKGRLISILEGGYDLNALSRSVNAHISVLME